MLSMNANSGPKDSSASTSSAHQGEKRKREGEQPLTSTESSGLTGSVTRQRIVEILSNTANGCLSELGYYPGMAGKLKELEAQNLKWRDENVKLYQDNQRLTQMVQNLNVNVALSGMSESDKTAKLQSELRRGQVENEHARKLSHLQQEYEKLVGKYNQLVQSYQMISQENQHLKNHLHGLSLQARIPYQPPQQLDISQQASHASTIRPNILPQHKDQNPQLQAQVQQSSLSRPSSAQSLQKVPNQVQQTELTQTQFAVSQHRQHSHSNPSSRRSSLNFVSPKMIQSPRVPSQPYTTTFPPNFGPQTQHHGLDGSRQVLPFGANFHPNMRRASAPNTPILHGNPYSFTPPPRIHSDPVEPGSIQSTGSSQVSQMLPPSIPNPSNVPAGNPVFAQAPSGSPAHVIQNSNTTPQIQKSIEPTLATSISPGDTYVNPPTGVQPTPTSLVSPQPLPAQNVPLQASQQVDAMFIPSPRASSSFPQLVPSMAPSNSPSSSMPENLPKNGDNQALSTEQLQLHGTASEPIDSVSAPQDTSASAGGDAMQVDTGEEEEDEEDVELGPDGLRLVKDCLVHIFGTPVDGRVTCKLCEHRFKSGFQNKPPSPFINATDTELEKHCVEEHQKPWEALRKP